jgi:hypothetical protein
MKPGQDSKSAEDRVKIVAKKLDRPRSAILIREILHSEFLTALVPGEH